MLIKIVKVKKNQRAYLEGFEEIIIPIQPISQKKSCIRKVLQENPSLQKTHAHTKSV